ncbi:hypothetical protein [Clostridium scatologenes]|uniref:Uncharacterized protein n=1 Tax=Clostridium scatologenes TaxID=1548 RepID=A0A0E3K1L8_CLOSL|nr:hypothetical protein [Clostridium scatologenes]AKA70127.1 hypothetical protein CSCA_3002 [Clostridium scatologenes]
MGSYGFKNFRDPVVYVLNQELRKRNLKNKLSIDNGDTEWNGELETYPIELVRDENNIVIKCLHGVGVAQWSEEFIRNEDGIVAKILMTYPDATTNTIQLIRDPLVHIIEEI